MGNIIQCCQSLSHYLKCKDASGQSEPENSPLLSGEESESESLSLPENLDDDLLTVSTVCGTSQTLEPQNFLFPDIILSSNPGGDVTLVEPMVCLLVCEEEEEEEDGGPEWSNRRRYREFSEVETQTEVETLIGMGVQTQTESQTPTKTLMCHIETEVRITTSGENKNGMVVDVMDEREIVRQEQERCSEIVHETPAGKQKKKMEWFDVDDFVEIEAEWTMDGKNRPSVRDTDEDTEAGHLKKSLICEELTTTSGANHKHTNEEENVFKMQQSADLSWTEQHFLRLQENIKDEEENSESETTAVILTKHNLHHMNGKTLALDSEKTVKPSVHNKDLLKNFDPTMCDVSRTRQRGPEDEQTVQEAGGSDQKVNESDFIDSEINKHLSEESILNRHHNQHQENLHPPERDEDDNKTAVCQVLDLETVQSQVEEDEDGDEMKNLALFSADRLPTLHINAPEGQTEKIPVDDSPEQPECDESKHADIPEIPDLQDEHLTVRIQPPRTESFALQVSGQLLVTELHQVLMEHQSTCHCTCFSLQLGGATLDSLTKLRCIQGIEDGALIKVMEESYSALDARLHLRHVRDLMRSLDPADAYNGVNCSSLSFLTFYTGGEKDRESVGSRQASKGEFGEFRPPEYILPGCRDPPLTPLQPLRQDRKPLQCLRVLTMSSWNPPPGNRKMHGDLMYLNVLSMEDKEFNITSSTRGFYLNQSTAFNFNPKPAVPKIFCHSLVELLSQVSPAFRKTFSVLQKKRVQLHPCERITTPFQVFTWTAHQEDHTLNCVRAEETPTSRMGRDALTAGQSRDWNEELQACRELKRNSFQERLQRDRSIFKINSDFVKAATRGAVAVIDGNAMPLNPGEVPHMQMFIWNNLFFSLGFDISEHYRPLGGNTAAHAAATCDLRGVQAYTSVDIEGLYTLGTAVVDYRGIRVIAQTVVPGILEKNQEQSVVYGSNDYGKTVFTHPKFVDLLDQTTKSLRIQRHQVLDHNNSPVELCSGIETKGILGNDGRPYILDLLRTFPPDLNFQFSESKESTKEVPELCRSFGYPRPHCHSLASLRPELIEAFVQNRHELYVKKVSQNLIHLEEQQESTEQREEPTSTTADMEVQRRNVIMNACKAVGSVSNSCFDIRFNPDVYSPGVRFSSECSAEVQRQRLLLWDAAAFLLFDQIPAVLRDCLDLTAEPMDGGTLTSVLHQQGVNVRYLGTLLRELDRMEERGRLSHIQRICVGEVIIRSAKHIFRSYLQDVEPAAFSAAVSHFLNCLLSSSSSFPDSGQDELLSRRRSRRRRSQGSRVVSLTESLWARLSPSELWCRIRTEAGEYYHYTVDSESMDEVIEKHNLQRISLLREFAIMTGVQVQLRDYMFESRHRPVFAEEDVVNMFPVVKHLKPKGTEATRLVQQAQVAIQQGLLRDGYELMNQALTLFSSVCGDLHEDVSLCLRLIARLSYILGEYADAISRQEKTVLISERVQGIDHPQTIQDYTHLGLYCFAGDRRSTSLQLLYRARYLMLLVTGEDHPHVALLDSMLGLVLHSLTEHKLSLKFLQNALILTSKYHGATSLRNAHSHHLLATVYESQGEFQSALHYEKEAYSIYRNEVGEAHDSTMESSEYMNSLINQAVSLSKPFNYTDGQTPCVQPPKFSTPSPPTILQQLNLTCGITLTPLR